MWGENILVAPILEKRRHKKNTIYLPAGKWYSFYDEMPIESDAITIAATAINQIPFYVKDGNFII